MSDSLYQDVLDALSHGGTHCHLVLFAQYRLDLARELAIETGMEYFDFRRECLAGLGAAAQNQSLELLDRALEDCAARGGCVLVNAESLLATQTQPARRAWLAEVVTRRYANPLLLPLALFDGEAPEGHARVIDLRMRPLPEQSLVSRLAHSGLPVCG